MRSGGTVGPGTRRERKPTVLALLQRVYSEGIDWTCWDFHRIAHGIKPPPRVTARLIGAILIYEYYQARADERDYTPDGTDLAIDSGRLAQIEMMRLAAGDPVGDPSLGHLDSLLQEEYAEYAQRAEALELELGRRFIDGTATEREDRVRRWIKRYRNQGRLPRTPPPLAANPRTR